MDWQNNLQQKMLAMKTVTLSFDAKEFDKKERSIKHWISKSNLDRGGDIVLPSALDTKNYKKNPIVLFNHNVYYPVASNGWLKTEEDGVLAKSMFSTTPFADDIYTLNVEKVLNAWSIGITPRKWDYDEKKEVTTFTDAELLEYSNVSIPMHQDAITEGLKMVKSAIAKNILSEAQQTMVVKSELSEMRDEINKLKELNDDIMERSQSVDMKDFEKLERELLEIKQIVNKLATGTSGKEKAMKEIIAKLRTGDVSGK